jgi:hypothetical protein
MLGNWKAENGKKNVRPQFLKLGSLWCGEAVKFRFSGGSKEELGSVQDHVTALLFRVFHSTLHSPGSPSRVAALVRREQLALLLCNRSSGGITTKWPDMPEIAEGEFGDSVFPIPDGSR